MLIKEFKEYLMAENIFNSVKFSVYKKYIENDISFQKFKKDFQVSSTEEIDNLLNKIFVDTKKYIIKKLSVESGRIKIYKSMTVGYYFIKDLASAEGVHKNMGFDWSYSPTSVFLPNSSYLVHGEYNHGNNLKIIVEGSVATIDLTEREKVLTLVYNSVIDSKRNIPIKAKMNLEGNMIERYYDFVAAYMSQLTPSGKVEDIFNFSGLRKMKIVNIEIIKTLDEKNKEKFEEDWKSDSENMKKVLGKDFFIGKMSD